MIKILVVLRPERLNRRPFAAVKHFYLHSRLVGFYAHLSAERVEFSDEMSFRRAAYRRIARHKGYIFKVYGDNRGLVTRTGKGESRLAAGVSRADDYRVVNAFCKLFHITF